MSNLLDIESGQLEKDGYPTRIAFARSV